MRARKGTIMDKRYYTAASLSAVLREYEERYGVTTGIWSRRIGGVLCRMA